MRKPGFFLMLLGLLAALGLVAGPAAARKAKPAPAPAAPDTTLPPPAEPQNIWYLDLSTGGRVAIQLRPDKAPKSVERIKTLTRQHFYDGLIFHRVIDGFMAQGGDPKGTGEGGSSLPDLDPEFNDLPHVRGVVSMARADEPNTANSQFFIVLQPTLRLDGKYTAVGRVISGMAYVDAIERGEPPANPSKIIHATMGADEPPPVTQADPAAAEKAAEAAAKAASEQAIDAQLQAEEARKAANAGNAADAAAEAARAQTSAQGAAQAASDAAQAAGDAAKATEPAPPPAAAPEAAPAPTEPEAGAPADPAAAAPAPEPAPAGR